MVEVDLDRRPVERVVIVSAGLTLDTPGGAWVPRRRDLMPAPGADAEAVIAIAEDTSPLWPAWQFSP